MSDDLNQLRQAMSAIGGHLQDLQAEQSATTRELSGMVGAVGDLGTHMGKLQEHLSQAQRDIVRLEGAVKNLQARSVQVEATTVALGGTFASIDQILAARVEALERRAS